MNKNPTSRRVNNGERRLLLNNNTVGSFVLSEGLYGREYLTSTIKGMMSCSPISTNEGEPLFTGAIIRFFGKDAAGKSFKFRIWLCKNAGSNVRVSLLGAGVATLGTKTGMAGSPVGAADMHAHGITFALATTGSTPRGPGAQLYTALGATVQIHSPLNNEVAELLLPELCSSSDILIEFEFNDATEANASVELIG